MSVFTGLTSIEFSQSKLPRSSWIQFGEEAFWMSDESEAPQMRQNPQTSQKENLYLVIQKGRVFQKEHPEIPVLFDKGRFLVVELESAQVQAWDKGDEPCYVIRPLQDYPVVFQVQPPPAIRRQSLPQFENLVRQVSQTSLEQTLEKLVSFPNRYSTGHFYNQAAIWSKEQLEVLGYQTRIDDITIRGKSSQNVVAWQLGQGTDNRQLVIVTAHLDSVNHDDEPSGNAPGADDNASGTTGVLEIAKIFSNQSHQHDLCLVLFGGEEQGLFGSKQYVQNLSAAERSRIKAVINMDMIGSLNTPTLTVMLEGAQLSQGVIEQLALAAQTYTGLTVQTSLNPFASDHVPFIKAGVPAVLTIEGADTANDTIHSANDTLDRINYPLMLEIIRMNVAFIAGAIEVIQE